MKSKPDCLLLSADVGEDAAKIGGAIERVDCKDGRRGAGEKGDVEIAALGVGNDPLGVVGAAERVFVQEALVRGDVDAEDVAAAGGVVRIEKSEGFFGFERANLRDGEVREVDGDLQG